MLKNYTYYLFILAIPLLFAHKTAAQSTRTIIVTGPDLKDTNLYQHRVGIGSTSKKGKNWPLDKKYFDLDSNSQVLTLTVPKDDAATHYDLELQVKRMDSWRFKSYRQHKKVKLETDTSYFDIRRIKGSKFHSHFIGEKMRALYTEDIFRSKVLVLGFHQGHQSYGDIMFGFSKLHRHDRYALVTRGTQFGTEFNFKFDDKFVLGPKIGVKLSTLLYNLSFHTVVYTDFNYATWVLKPSIGFNPLTPLLDISYSYNVAVTQNHFGTRLNLHQLSVHFTLPLTTKELVNHM